MEAVGTVVALNGEAVAESSSGVRTLSQGDSIFQNETLTTSQGANLEIRFIDESVLSQGPDSQITIDEYVYDPSQANASAQLLNMAKGTFRVVTGQIADSNPDGVQMSTPLATIGIRGTGVDFHIPQDGGPERVGLFQYDNFDLFVSTDAGMSFLTGPGVILDVAPDGTLGDPRPYTPAEMQHFQQAAPITSIPDLAPQGDDEGDEEEEGQEGQEAEGEADGGGEGEGENEGEGEGEEGEGEGEGEEEELEDELQEEDELAEDDLVDEELAEAEEEMEEAIEEAEEAVEEAQEEVQEELAEAEEAVEEALEAVQEQDELAETQPEAAPEFLAQDTGGDEGLDDGGLGDGGLGTDTLAGGDPFGSDTLGGEEQQIEVVIADFGPTTQGTTGPELPVQQFEEEDDTTTDDETQTVDETTASVSHPLSGYFSSTLTGTASGEVIHGTSGMEIIFGDAGDDTICAMGGTDVLVGGAGEDYLYGNDNPDAPDLDSRGRENMNIASYFGNTEAINANLENGVVTGVETNEVDHLYGIRGIDGSEKCDTMIGSSTEENWFHGSTGNDYIDGVSKKDNEAHYGAASGSVTVDLQNGRAYGADGDDTLLNIQGVTGSDYDDTLIGQDGENNHFEGGDGDDSINGGALGANNWNEVSYESASGGVFVNLETGLVTGAAGNDTLVNITDVEGSNYDDTLYGFNDDTLTGVNAARTGVWFAPGLGNDIVDGVSSVAASNYSNQVSYAGSVITSVVVDLAAGSAVKTAVDGTVYTDTLSNIHRVTSSYGDDSVYGDGEANYFNYRSGNDVFDGRGGSDTVSFLRALYGVEASLASDSATLQGGNYNTASLTSIEGLEGSKFDDTLTGQIGESNWLSPDAGSDNVDGGALSDNNTLNYSNSTGFSTGIIANMNTGEVKDTDESFLDQVQNFARLWGTRYDDSVTGSDNVSQTFTYAGLDGDDTIRGGGATEIISGDNGNDSLEGGAGDDTISGGDGNDWIDGQAGIDVMSGGEGNDTFAAGAGDDSFDGGGGLDVIDFSGILSAVAIDFNLGSGSISNGESGTDTYTSIEGVVGGANGDTLTGNSDANLLVGYGGADTLIGGAGADTLYGSGGIDCCLDVGVDTDVDWVHYDSPSEGGAAELIYNFDSGEDKITFFINSLGGSFTAGQTLTASQFVSMSGYNGTNSGLAGEGFVFDTGLEKLYYDNDGSGSGKIEICRLQNTDGCEAPVADDILILGEDPYSLA